MDDRNLHCLQSAVLGRRLGKLLMVASAAHDLALASSDNRSSDPTNRILPNAQRLQLGKRPVKRMLA
jgi:hypothetical protein